MISLILVHDDGPEVRFNVSGEQPALIGRYALGVEHNDAKLSRRHAEIVLESGVWLVRDLGSTNGTFVNGQRVTGIAELEVGDRIRTGRTQFIVEGITDLRPVLGDHDFDPGATAMGTAYDVLADFTSGTGAGTGAGDLIQHQVPRDRPSRPATNTPATPHDDLVRIEDDPKLRPKPKSASQQVSRPTVRPATQGPVAPLMPPMDNGLLPERLDDDRDGPPIVGLRLDQAAPHQPAVPMDDAGESVLDVEPASELAEALAKMDSADGIAFDEEQEATDEALADALAASAQRAKPPVTVPPASQRGRSAPAGTSGARASDESSEQMARRSLLEPPAERGAAARALPEREDRLSPNRRGKRWPVLAAAGVGVCAILGAGLFALVQTDVLNPRQLLSGVQSGVTPDAVTGPVVPSPQTLPQRPFVAQSDPNPGTQTGPTTADVARRADSIIRPTNPSTEQPAYQPPAPQTARITPGTPAPVNTAVPANSASESANALLDDGTDVAASPVPTPRPRPTTPRIVNGDLGGEPTDSDGPLTQAPRVASLNDLRDVLKTPENAAQADTTANTSPANPEGLDQTTRVTDANRRSPAWSGLDDTMFRNPRDGSLADANTAAIVELPGSAPSNTAAPVANAALAAPAPAITAVTQANRNVAFLVDSSGTMIDSLPQLQDYLRRAIDRLDPQQSFTIVLFRQGDAVELPPAGLRPATLENKARARQWIDQGAIRPGGRSDPKQALDVAVQYTVDDLYFLSGDSFGKRAGPGGGDMPLEDFVDALTGKRIKVHGVQFFYEDPTGLLRRLTQRYNGTFQFVNEIRNADPSAPDIFGALYP